MRYLSFLLLTLMFVSLHPLAQSQIPISADNADQIVQIDRFGRGSLLDIALSPDGRMLAVGSYAGVWLYDLTQAGFMDNPVLLGNDDTYQGTSVDFSPDSRTLASTGSEGAVYVWDVIAGTKVRTLEGMHSQSLLVKYSPDGETIVSGGDTRIVFWDLQPDTVLNFGIGRFTGIDFSSDGSLLAASVQDGRLGIWNMQTGEMLHLLNSALQRDTDLEFMPDNQTLIAGDRRWNALSGEEISKYITEGQIFELALSPNGRILISGGGCCAGNNIVRVWDTQTETLLHRLEEHNSRLIDLEYSSDGQTLVSASFTGIIKFWDLSNIESTPESTAIPVTSFESNQSNIYTSVTDAVFVPLVSPLAQDEQTIIICKDGKLSLLSLISFVSTDLIEASTNEFITCFESVIITSDGLNIATKNNDAVITLWRVSDTGSTMIEAQHTLPVNYTLDMGFDFSPDGRLLATGHFDNSVRLFDVESGDLVGTLNGHTDSISGIAMSNDGQTLRQAAKMERSYYGILLQRHNYKFLMPQAMPVGYFFYRMGN